ncbi:MAG: release factor glutamine methyltransferase [Cycloclasticus sp.]|jgi:release factor glutamine methyltransferase
MEVLTDSPSCRLECEVLLAYVLQKNRSHLRAWPDKALSDEQYAAYKKLLEQRQKGRPIAYLTGEKEFWSRSFFVSEEVLIPRPETELLIDIIQQKFNSDDSFTALDLGTGSGAIAVTLACEFNNANVVAVDISNKALLIAQKNAKQLGANNIRFIQSDWFQRLPDTQFDLIVSNPPYICSTDPHLQRGDLRFEPSSALVAKQQGTQDFLRIIAEANSFLQPGGFLLFEHGYQQGNHVQNLLDLAGFKLTEQFEDLQGHPRATIGQKL